VQGDKAGSIRLLEADEQRNIEDCEEGRTLRRTGRTRKGVVTPVVVKEHHSVSDIDSTETEIGWSGQERD